MVPNDLIVGCMLVICLGSVTAFPLGGQDIPDEWPVLKPCAHMLHPQACTDSLLMTHISVQLKAFDAPEGLLVLAFTVDTLGQLTEAEVLRDPLGQGHGLLESLNQLPAWIPGRRNGQAVAVPFRIPIRVGGQAEPDAGYTLLWGTNSHAQPSKKRLKKMHPEVLLVLASSGDTLTPVQINATWKKGRRTSSITIPPQWDGNAVRWLRRCPIGAQLELEAIINQGTRFLAVQHTWIMQP